MANMVLPVAALCFAAWAVYLGGLASMHKSCDDLMGSSGKEACRDSYRYNWFIMAWEIVIVAAAAVASITNQLHMRRPSFVGLFAVATMLFINAGNTGLQMLDAASVAPNVFSMNMMRLRTVTAGAIMTATANALMMLVLGCDVASGANDSSRAAAAAASTEAAAAKAEAV